jgi:hypothetical protein
LSFDGKSIEMTSHQMVVRKQSESSVEEIVFVRESCWAMCLLNSFAFLLDHGGRDHWSGREFEVEHCENGESSLH